MDSELNKHLDRKIINPHDLEKKVQELRSQGYSIATLNGSFDLLHSGHLFMLFEAKKQADKLILLLNSDSSIQAYKGKNRPIIPLKERLKLLAAVEFVDYLSWFDETEPLKILSLVKPDVHVNGSEYGESCVEAEVVKENGGRLYLAPRIEGLSTSNIIKRIVEQCES